MKELIELLNGINWQNVVIGIGIGSAVLGALAKALGWKRGAMIADEIHKSLQNPAMLGLLTQAKYGDVNAVTKASTLMAATTKGLTISTASPIVNAAANVAENKPELLNGIKITMDAGGNLSVDPSGLVQKAANKAGKFLKKIF